MNRHYVYNRQVRHIFRNITLPVVLNCLFAATIVAHGGNQHHQSPDTMQAARMTVTDSLITAPAAPNKIITETAPPAGVIGFEEKKGAILPLNARFAQQNGDSVTLGECVNGPTILLFLYFGCHDACNLLLTGLAQVLQSYHDKPSFAPNIVTISVSENEGPKDAVRAIEIANAALGQPYPADKWRFLTGSAMNIRNITDAVGFHFVKKGDDYDHPLLLIILSPKGKITRYITGTDFLPTDLALSLMEASNGTVQPTIARVLRSCFSYDPESRRMVFKTLQVSATVIITLFLSFVIFLVIASKSRRNKGTPK